MQKNTKPPIGVRVQPEPLVSYESLLLSYLDFCGKVPRLRLGVCVDYLISLLPTDLQERINKRVQHLISIVNNTVLEACSNFTVPTEEGGKNHEVEVYTRKTTTLCWLPSSYLPEFVRVVLGKIREKHGEVYERFYHILPRLIASYTSIDIGRWDVTGVPLAKLAITVEELLKEGIIGPKSGRIAIGTPPE